MQCRTCEQGLPCGAFCNAKLQGADSAPDAIMPEAVAAQLYTSAVWPASSASVPPSVAHTRRVISLEADTKPIPGRVQSPRTESVCPLCVVWAWLPDHCLMVLSWPPAPACKIECTNGSWPGQAEECTPPTHASRNKVCCLSTIIRVANFHPARLDMPQSTAMRHLHKQPCPMLLRKACMR